MRKQVGRYLAQSCQGVRRAGVMASVRGHDSEPIKDMNRSLEASNIEVGAIPFGGESSLEEVARIVSMSKQRGGFDVLIGAGGGKCIDAAKMVAHRLAIPCVVFPSLASNDAPCSALSVVYHEDHTWRSIEYFPFNPLMVVVDPEVILTGGERFLVSGMGDALATYYEACVCADSPNGLSSAGGKTTLAAKAIAKMCRDTILESGHTAIQACRDQRVSDDFEKVCESNILLSGIGFESGGLACAHSMAAALTNIPRIEQHFHHGEHVSLGTLTQLALLRQDQELETISRFNASVGLPNQFSQVGLDLNAHLDDLAIVAEAACRSVYMSFMPFPVSPSALIAAMKQVDSLGCQFPSKLHKR